MKSHRFLVYYSPPNFFSSSIKEFSFPCYVGTCTWLTMAADPSCNSLLILNKPIFAGELSGSLFILGQWVVCEMHLGGMQPWN